MSKRIRSSNVQLGESFMLGQPLKVTVGEAFDDENLSKEELYLRLKEKELKQRLDQMLVDAQNQAASIISDANSKASQIWENAKQGIIAKEQEIETCKNQAKEEARQLGVKIGYDEGYQKAYDDVHLKVINLEAIADSSFKIKKEIILSAELEILNLSIAIAEKVLKKQLEIKPQMITEIIRSAISELKDKEEIKIIINPVLKEQMYNFSEELKASIKGMKVVKIIEDRTIHANSAIVESPESRIDARIETQIAKITEEIMKTFAEEPALIEIIEEDQPKIKKMSSKKSEKGE